MAKDLCNNYSKDKCCGEVLVENWISHFGVPLDLQTRAPLFFLSQSDSMVERFNGTLETSLKMMVNEH